MDPRALRRVWDLGRRVFDETNPNLPGAFLFGHYFRSYYEKEVKIARTKMHLTDLNSPRRELSNGGLRIVVALLVHWQIILCVIILENQSSCSIHLVEWYKNMYQWYFIGKLRIYYFFQIYLNITLCSHMQCIYVSILHFFQLDEHFWFCVFVIHTPNSVFMVFSSIYFDRVYLSNVLHVHIK